MGAIIGDTRVPTLEPGMFYLIPLDLVLPLFLSITVTEIVRAITDWYPRLHRAMMHLSAPEAITLAFVLGAGIGSIMHLIFMLCLISIRRLRGGGLCHRSARCEVWRAERQKRREARKAAKAAKREGRLRLDDSNTTAQPGGGEEVLPSYAEGEADRLVEKA